MICCLTFLHFDVIFYVLSIWLEPANVGMGDPALNVATHQLPNINQGQSNSYPNSTNGNGRYHVNQAYNVAGVSPPQFGNQSISDGGNRATSAGMHGRVDWKAKYLK